MKKYCTGCYNVLLVKHTVLHTFCPDCKEYVVIADTRKQAKGIHKAIEEVSKHVIKKWDEETKKFLSK